MWARPRRTTLGFFFPSHPAMALVAEPLPMASPSTSDSRIVRFDSECVLIPEYSSRRRPRMVTKSYSLPLWKRRSPSLPDEDAPAPPLSTSPEDTHVVIRVPIPSFVRRSSRSPSRPTPTSPTLPPPPCLVQRRLPISPTISPVSPTRRVSLPTYHRRPDDQTIPLRACCPDCLPITEECLREGATWKEKFTKGAKRRRSASLDSTTGSSTLGSSIGGKVAFIPASYDVRMPVSGTPPFSITVDEVDKRRKSQERPRSRSASPTGNGGRHSAVVHSHAHE
ncbi:hypothetical protein P691DRAFT_260279 [Macrolepiota fuliginosa MF-IS2]|uniref:Uncharacterized protein n=1 Tax=Macrolepiota fuliginosa MF-IS2 TaxID=1400762 RepID=A0A9P5X8G8_9AGAR|nr:hypothetical protein P691DRAFT_260279 [Macrolepiota fuliginosa MF-IS2]